MIELRASQVVDDFAILEVICSTDISQNLFIRFVRAKVSIENLLPATSIVRSSRETGDDYASLAWKVHAPAIKAHLAFVRAALDVMGIPYEYKSGVGRRGVGGQVGRHARTQEDASAIARSA